MQGRTIHIAIPSICVDGTMAIDGQMTLTFLRATWRFNELNALLASTSKTALLSGSLKAWFIACTAASVPAFWLPQSWNEPAASWMSPFVTERIAFAMFLLTTSQMPMGHTPGFLSSAVRRHDINGARTLGSKKSL